jgi:hypothetical protein
MYNMYIPYFNVTLGGIGVVREHQLQKKKKAQPLPFIKGGTTKEEEKTNKQKS